MTVMLELDTANDSHTRRTLSEISLAVAKSKKIVVVTGAGISCSCGIPVCLWFWNMIRVDINRVSGFSLFRWALRSSKRALPRRRNERP